MRLGQGSRSGMERLDAAVADGVKSELQRARVVYHAAHAYLYRVTQRSTFAPAGAPGPGLPAVWLDLAFDGDRAGPAEWVATA